MTKDAGGWVHGRVRLGEWRALTAYAESSPATCAFGIPRGSDVLLRQLRYFHAVAEEGSVMRASTRLRVAQPALSRHLQALETTVGTSLLDREPRGVSPTPAGRILLVAIKPIFARIDGALDRVRLASEGKLGTLRVGLARAAVDSSILARAMKKLRQEQPHVRIIAIQAAATHQAEMLRTLH